MQLVRFLLKIQLREIFLSHSHVHCPSAVPCFLCFPKYTKCTALEQQATTVFPTQPPSWRYFYFQVKLRTHAACLRHKGCKWRKTAPNNVRMKDHRRYVRNFKQLWKENLTKNLARLGFEHMTSAIPVQCSTNWAINWHEAVLTGSWQFVMYRSTYFIYFTDNHSFSGNLTIWFLLVINQPNISLVINRNEFAPVIN